LDKSSKEIRLYKPTSLSFFTVDLRLSAIFQLRGFGSFDMGHFMLTPIALAATPHDEML